MTESLSMSRSTIGLVVACVLLFALGIVVGRQLGAEDAPSLGEATVSRVSAASGQSIAVPPELALPEGLR